MTDREIAETLLALIKEQSISRTELAQRAGIDPSAVNRFLAGRGRPLLPNAVAMFEALGYTFFIERMDEE